MKTIWSLLLLLSLQPGRAQAQVPPVTVTVTITAGQSLVWDVKGATPAIAQSEVWKFLLDGVPLTVPLAASCVAASAPLNPATDATCSALPPAIAPGVKHQVAVAAFLADGTALGVSNIVTVVTQLLIINLRAQ